ncbi:hypothetical protein BEE12_16110 [Pantoea agglomerans]|nr:hypothetical protein BEE12_16110 [Pantoea agglomerans]
MTVLVGIGKHTKQLREGVDYTLQGNVIRFAEPPTLLTDIYGLSAWPERFDSAEIVKRRERTRTINEWDSQYMLIAKPVNKVRLDPQKIREYDCEIEFTTRNREIVAMLGNVRIISMSCYWDVSTGKRKADASALSLMLTDDRGHLYWHICEELQGELAEFNERGLIDGGQVWQIRNLVRKYNIPNVQVEVNGVGSFAGKLLKQALKGTHCGVTEVVVSTNKQQRILEAFEGPLSGNFLWGHSRVLDGEAYSQMRDFNPAVTDQPDDFIDSGAGAIHSTPIRIGNRQTASGNPVQSGWRTNGGNFEVQTSF